MQIVTVESLDQNRVDGGTLGVYASEYQIVRGTVGEIIYWHFTQLLTPVGSDDLRKIYRTQQIVRVLWITLVFGAIFFLLKKKKSF